MASLQPRYITIDDIEGYIGGITLISNEDPNALNTDIVNSLIAQAESRVELELSRFFATPFQTLEGESWEELPVMTYTVLHQLFVYKANEMIIGAFCRDNISSAESIKIFEKNYYNEYRSLLKDIVRQDNSGYYMVQLPGIMLSQLYVPRQPTQSYARSGSFGNYNNNQNFRYALSRSTDYSKTWGNRNKGGNNG